MTQIYFVFPNFQNILKVCVGEGQDGQPVGGGFIPTGVTPVIGFYGSIR
jgi:hypothetical protein